MRGIMSSTRILAVGFLLAAGAPAAGAQDTASIDSIFRFATADAPGCAVGVSLAGVHLVAVWSEAVAASTAYAADKQRSR